MTTNEITQTARRKVLEKSDEIISNETVLLYANQAYIEVYKQVFTTNKIVTATVACTAGVCVLPTRYGRMYAKGIDQDGNEYEEFSIADYHQQVNNAGYTIDSGQLLVSSTDVSALTVRYYEQPETLTSDVDPSIDPFFHESIVYGIIWRLHEDLQDEELSVYYKQLFKDDIAERISNQSIYEETNQKGGQMFEYQKLI